LNGTIGVNTGRNYICFNSLTAVIANKVAFSEVGSMSDYDIAM